MGGHVNVPCTSYRIYSIYCHVAKISGNLVYVNLACGENKIGNEQPMWIQRS